ncbi:uncharacterized protein LOC124841506 [Vigna umbellata]|uniref:uncharacterized protein LOC124841506 n=1 Tax=Vigna umbellata TaxID=87088 RepID=UPI001F5E6E30|nr:uncharacterized protein LOC124841506 [Vigna umbellata]XP_047173742.1 uncharacterized protein LOC124841506 [Vigna umbellata]XP_047173743.1 uncharacterized protein LOC124841506 [Vigna umbellata]XP_047173744.1 uncharacterized protein LOC124841506 [Vigna umbellata]
MSLLQKGLCCVFHVRNHNVSSINISSAMVCTATNFHAPNPPSMGRGKARRILKPLSAALPVPPPLDLTEDNVRQALEDARQELGQIFDTSVGMTGVVELADLDGPFVKLSLRGRFWHKRSTVIARIANYLKQRIPEILEVDIEDEKQLDDSPESF